MEADWDVSRIERLSPDPKALIAARDLLKGKRFSAIETLPDGRGWWAKCRGQTDDYEVSASRPTAGNFSTHCTCPSRKQPCKHAVALLLYLAAHPAARPDDAPAAPVPPPRDFEALLSAVFADPDDDLARLVFADFVEEQGDADRATLVRLQVERARAGAGAGAKPRRGEADRLPPAEATLAGRVLAAVPDSVRESFRFRRGFLTYTQDPYSDAPGLNDSRAWPRAVRDLFAAGWVETVRVVAGDYSNVLPPLTAAGVDVCLRVGTVDFGVRTLTPESFADAAAELRPGLSGGRLQRVVVPDGNREQWEELTGTAGHLGDAGLQPSEDGTRTFTDPPDMLFARQLAAGAVGGVHALTVTGGLSVAAARALAECPDAVGLTALTLSHLALGADHADALGASPHLAGVRTLALHAVGFDPGAAAAWLASPLAARVETLDLKHSAPLTDADLSVLHAGRPALANLTLPYDGPTLAAVRALLASGACPRLSDLGTGDRPEAPAERIALRLEFPGVARVRFGPVVWSLAPLAAGGYALTLARAAGPGEYYGAVPPVGDVWPAGVEALDWSAVRASGSTGARCCPVGCPPSPRASRRVSTPSRSPGAA